MWAFLIELDGYDLRPRVGTHAEGIARSISANADGEDQTMQTGTLEPD
jgi:hypothetical protein